MALIGRSGSGKSTLLRCIDRFETIDSGEIVGVRPSRQRPELDLRALRQDVGIVFQSYNLFPHLTIEQNITLAPCSGEEAVRRPKRRSRRAEVLAQVGLETSSHPYPEQLSGGQQQRVADRPLARHAAARSCCSTR